MDGSTALALGEGGTAELAQGRVRNLRKVFAIGSITGPGFEADLETERGKGLVRSLADLEAAVLKSPGGVPVRLRDVASADLGARRYTSFARRAGKPVTTMVIYQLPGANALDVPNKIRAFMQEAQKSFPPGLEYEVSYDNTWFVRAALMVVTDA
jgi:multidrug efflux pump subunit AcrB